MLRQAAFYSLLTLTLLLSACVAKNKYVALEANLGETEAQLKQRSDSLSEAQAHNAELQVENARHLRTIQDLTLNLGQAQATIREREASIQALKHNLEEAESTVRQRDRVIEDLRANLNQTEAVVRQKETTISELDKTRHEIESSLKNQIAQKDVKIEEIEGKLKVTFVDKILFDSGRTDINKRGKEVLLTLAKSFAQDPDKNIVVEGHTDNVAIAYPLRQRFPTNWELSTARAATVVRFLQEEGNIAPERLTATGYSYYNPVAPNDTEESRSQNRRIEIILVPKR